MIQKLVISLTSLILYCTGRMMQQKNPKGEWSPISPLKIVFFFAKHRRRELKQTYILYPVSCSSHNLGTNIRTKLKTDGRTKSHLEVCTLSKKKVSVACENDSIRKISKIS